MKPTQSKVCIAFALIILSIIFGHAYITKNADTAVTVIDKQIVIRK